MEPCPECRLFRGFVPSNGYEVLGKFIYSVLQISCEIRNDPKCEELLETMMSVLFAFFLFLPWLLTYNAYTSIRYMALK